MTERRHQMSKNPQWYYWTFLTLCAFGMCTVGVLGFIGDAAARSSFYPVNDIVVDYLLGGLVVSSDITVRLLGLAR